jgi:valyl-tRNA synthetase
VTEEIYHVLFEINDSESIHIAKWPEILEDHQNNDLLECGSAFMEIVNKIRHFKTNITESFSSEINCLSLITENSLLHESLEDLAGLARAKSVYVNEKIEGGEQYKIRGGGNNPEKITINHLQIAKPVREI